MSSIPDEQASVNCINCGKERPPFVIGTIEDHCPNCGFKEGCCD